MKINITAIYFVLSFFSLISCKSQNERKKIIHIFCDNFPELKIDSTKTDSLGLKKYIQEELAKNPSDSIEFIIECPDNIALDNITITKNILYKQISLYRNNESKIGVYNKCLSEMWLPFDKKNRNPADLVINIDSKGNLFRNESPISIDAICKEFKGQNITIEIIAENSLTLDKLSKTIERFEKEKFKVLLGK